MNVIREDVSAEVAVLKVQVSPADYQKQVENTLDKYRRQAKIPGFRPGKVPMGLIRKQYGRAVLAEELNKLVNDSLYKFVLDEKLDILGNPIPKEDYEVKGDFNNPGDFEFAYEIGFTPIIDVKLSSKDKFDYVSVKVDDEMIGKQVDDLRRRYGKLESVEEVGDKDLVLAQFTELNDDETEKEGGIVHSSTISMEFVEDKAAVKALKGKKAGDTVVLNPAQVSRDEKDMKAMLGVKADEERELSGKFRITVNQIRRMELAELNQELFDKLYGPGAVMSEKDMRQRIADDMKNMFSGDADRLLTRSVYDHLLANTKVDLPNDFLKRWIQLSNEKPITLEEIEASYEQYEKGMKWQLIQTHIFKSNEIKLGQEEAINFTKGLIANNYAQYGIPAPEDAELTESAQKALSNKEESGRIYDMLAEAKLTEFFKSTVKLNNKEVSYDDFVKLASAQN